MNPSRRFAFRLALAAGEINPDAMLARLPQRIWSEWQEFALLEPFGETGEERADLRTGIVAATIADCLARREGQPAYKARDFTPQFETGEPIQSESKTNEHYQQALMITRLFGGKIVKAQELELAD